MQTFKEICGHIIRNSKQFRKEKNHSQEEAQEDCGLNLSRIESNDHDLRLTSLVAMANYGSRTIAEVFKQNEGA